MKTFTVKNIMDLDPCEGYSHERVAALFAGRRRLSLRQILALRIPAEDRIWVATRLLPPREQRLFACDCAERVLPIYERAHPGDDRPRRAIETAREAARGEATEEELEAARAAALAAYRAAYRAAKAAYWAANAAKAAYWAANAAKAAYWAAETAADAPGAAEAAYRAAEAGDTERKWQVERLRVYAKELETA